MTIDTSRTVEIAGSPIKQFGLIVASLLLTAGSAVLAFRLFPDIGAYGRLIGWSGLIFFGACTLILPWRIATQRATVVTIARDGIRDIRVAPEFIPWRAIKRISTWEYRQQKIMVLAVDPAVERTLTLTRMARWTRGANAAFGADGLCVSATGLKTDYDALLATTNAFWQARRPT